MCSFPKFWCLFSPPKSSTYLLYLIEKDHENVFCPQWIGSVFNVPWQLNVFEVKWFRENKTILWYSEWYLRRKETTTHNFVLVYLPLAIYTSSLSYHGLHQLVPPVVHIANTLQHIDLSFRFRLFQQDIQCNECSGAACSSAPILQNKKGIIV